MTLISKPARLLTIRLARFTAVQDILPTMVVLGVETHANRAALCKSIQNANLQLQSP